MITSIERRVSVSVIAPLTAWCIASIAALALIEIPFLSIVILLATLSVFAWFGNVVCHGCQLGSLGFGTNLVIGIGSHVVISQMLLISNFDPQISHWTSLVILLVIGSLVLLKAESHRKLLRRIDAAELLFSTSIGVLVFAVRQPWLLPFGIALVTIERALQHEAWRRAGWRLVGLFLIAGLGFLLSWFLRLDRWSYLYLGGDTGFFESIGWITSEFGVFEHPGLSGGSIAGYHWLSYTFLGGISHLSGLPPWDATTKVGVPLLLVMLAGIVTRAPWRTTIDKIRLPMWALVLGVLVGASFIRYESAAFGIVAGLGFLSVVGRYFTPERPQPLNLVVVGIVSFTVIMSKATTGLVVGAALCVLAFGYRGRGLRNVLAPILVFSTVGVFAYLVFFRTSQFTEAGQTVRVSPPLTVLREVILGTPFFVWGALLVLMVLIDPRARSNKNPGGRFVRSLALVSTASIALGFVAQYQQQVMHAAFLLTVVCASWSLAGLLPSEKTSTRREMFPVRYLLGIFLIPLLAGFLLPVVYNRLDQMTNIPESLGVTGWDLTRKIFPFVIPWLTVLYMVGRRSRSTQLMSFVVIVVASLLSGLTLDQARRTATWGPAVAVNWALNDSAMPNDDLRAIGSHIRSTTNPETILASNDFCCFGDLWWKEIVRDLEAHASKKSRWWQVLQTTDWWKALESEYGRGLFEGSIKDTRLGGDNYLLAGDSRRRVLIQGLKHQAAIPTPDQVNRMTLSLAFANDPDIEIVRELKRYGVSGFVVNLNLTDQRDWSQFAVEKFRSGNYVFLRLN